MDLISYQPLWYETQVTIQAHVFTIRNIAFHFATTLGFPSFKKADIGICVSEIAQNHIDHHTRAGRIRLFGQRLMEDRILLTISSMDQGPGIAQLKNFSQFFEQETKGLGSGIASVKRLADHFAICSGRIGSSPCPDLLQGSRELETLVVSSFYWPFQGLEAAPIELSFLIRPFRGSRHCGDGVSYKYSHPFMRLVVMDALGKGREAAKAVLTAKGLLEILPVKMHPSDVLQCIGQHLMGSRGLMAQVMRINVEKRSIDISTIGDICQHLYLDGKAQFISGQSGLVGPLTSKGNFLNQNISSFNNAMGIIYTDGLKEIPRLKFNQALMKISPMIWANYLFCFCNQKSLDEDDAALVVWKWKN